MNPLIAKSSKRVLHMTDKYGVSAGYKPAYRAMLAKAGIQMNQVLDGSIYTLIPNPMVKFGNEKTMRFNKEMLGSIRDAFAHKVAAVKPDVIVVSDPACLGIFTNGDQRIATLEKLRGGVYSFDGIPVVITYPFTVINTHVDETLLKDSDGEDVSYEPYRVKSGNWILSRDFEKVGRILHGVHWNLPRFEYSVARSIGDLKSIESWLADCTLIATDVETGGFPAQITCIGFTGLKASGACRTFIIPFIHQFSDSGLYWQDEFEHRLAWETTHRILNNPVQKTMHNGFYDSSYFIKYRLGVNNWIWDTMVAWWSAYMELPKTLDFVSSILLDNYQYWKDDIKGASESTVDKVRGIEGYWRYCGLDCYNTLWNTVKLASVIQGNEVVRNVYEDAFKRVLSGLHMSMTGIKADLRHREKVRERLEIERDEKLELFRFVVADNDFNINSPDQKSSLFYDVLGARERTAKGRFVSNPPKKGENRSAGAIALKQIAVDHPYFGYIVKHLKAAMEPDKQISNVMNIKLQTSRFRTAFNGIGTGTTRFSSKKSNFWDGGNAQNIREEFRDWLVADEGCVIMDVDFSQSDDVFMGYEANDRNKIEVIESGMDGHAVHGELFFKVPYDKIVEGKKANDPWIVHPTTGIRQLSKRIVHGTNFQMAALTLYMTMGREAVVAAAKLLGHMNAESYSQEQLVNSCGQLMMAYRKKYPRFTKKEYYLDILNMLRAGGRVTNAFGVTRRFLGDPEDNGTQREATGFIGQSDTAGNMNRSMYEWQYGWIPKSFRDGVNPCANERPLQMDWESHGFQILLQVHDSFVIQLNTKHPRWKEAAHNVLHVMERPVIINGHTVRVKTEAAIGTRWSKKMPGWKSKDPHDLDRIVASL